MRGREEKVGCFFGNGSGGVPWQLTALFECGSVGCGYRVDIGSFLSEGTVLIKREAGPMGGAASGEEHGL